MNRKDRFGKNVFEGGFLGLDNIGVFDRSAPLPTGGHLEQADGTAWMAFFSQNMLELAIELAANDPHLRGHGHEVRGALLLYRRGDEPVRAGRHVGRRGRLLLRPAAATRWECHPAQGALYGRTATPVRHDGDREVAAGARPASDRAAPETPATDSRTKGSHPSHRATGIIGVAERGILALVNPERLRRILTKMLDENEFLSPYGIRSLSKFHEQHPYIFHVNGQEYRVDYLPAESNTGMFGGNSNWRGPIWMPVNVLIIRALLNFHLYYGDNFKIECPTGSGNMMNLFEVAKEIADRLGRIFLRDEHGRRPVYGGAEKFQNDPHWRDYILFYEYFHGDNGAGLGASHQTGWTGLVAKTMQLFGLLDAKTTLEGGKQAVFKK